MGSYVPTAHSIRRELLRHANPVKAKLLAGFFKTGKGQYGEGDSFLGIMVPTQRRIAHRFKRIQLKEIGRLLKEPIHECRFTALEILVDRFEEALKNDNKILCDGIIDFYLSHTKYINNWDLVDASAPYILGAYLAEFKKSPAILYKLAHSDNLWERRIAIVSTFYFIARDDFRKSIKITKIILQDEHDLIHKAAGWMLREVGKRDKKVLIGFLQKYAMVMPRTMLRYAIEKFDTRQRQKYLNMAKI